MSTFQPGIRLTLFILLLVFSTVVWSQTGDSTLQQPDTTAIRFTDTNVSANDDGFSLFLLLYGLTAVSLMISVALVGVAVSIGILFLIMILVGVGIISASVTMGFLKRSAFAGVKAFIYIICAVIGAIAGASGFWIISMVFHVSESAQTAFYTGIVCGALGGILWAFLFLLFCRKVLIIRK